MFIIGPQIPNYHLATGIFVGYSGQQSVNRPFGYWAHIPHPNTGRVR